MSRWLELLRRLGEDLLDWAAAEVAAVGDDLRSSGREAVKAGVLLLVAVALALIAWAILTFALVGALALVMPLWVAAAAVGAIYAVVAAMLGFAARRRMRRIESPSDTVKRHWRDQSRWLRERVLALPGEEGSDEP